MHRRNRGCERREYLSSRLPGLSRKIISRYFPKHRSPGITQAVVDEADVRAPALVARNPARLILSRGRFPKHIEVHIHLAQIADGLAQFAGANASVEVDNCRG